MTTHATSKGITWLFFIEIVKLHGMLESIMTDCDPKFTSKSWKEVHRLIGTKLPMSTAFHLQMDGATEQANHSIGQVLWALVHSNQKDWVELCPMVEFALQ